NPAPRALHLTGQEISTLKMLSPFLGGSPRRARRFVNVYRVAKASLTPAEIKKLEQSEHRALATQLAIATGAPRAFGPWAAACESAKGEELLRGEFYFACDATERRNIEGALEVYREMPHEQGTDLLKGLAAQLPRASRFSFSGARQ